MTSRTRLWVLALSTPVIAFAIVGGYLGRVLGAGKDDTLRQLPVFEEVISRGLLDSYLGLMTPEELARSGSYRSERARRGFIATP